jgi:hypothetical protein
MVDTLVWHSNYLYSKDLQSIDNDKLFIECLEVESYLKQTINLQQDSYKEFGSFTTSIFQKYNLFSFPCKEASILYRELVSNIIPYLDKSEHYWIQCWFNVFRENESINWHSHWDKELKIWHGFYCVNTKNSYTEYKIPNLKEIIKVPSQDSRLVFGKSDGDEHRSSIWENKNKPRVTIAFDIIPSASLNKIKMYTPNHYIPFK